VGKYVVLSVLSAVLPIWLANRESGFHIIPGDQDGFEALTC